MQHLNENDLIIIKQSQSWASRSYSKLKSIFGDREYGRFLRQILDKTVVIRDKSRSIYDLLVAIREKTINDTKAMSEFREIKLTCDTIRATILGTIVPALMKNGVDIVQYYRDQEEQERKAAAELKKKRDEEKKKQEAENKKQEAGGNPEQSEPEQTGQPSQPKEKINRPATINVVGNMIAEIRGLALQENATGLRDKAANDLEGIIQNMQEENVSDDDFTNLFRMAQTVYAEFNNAHKSLAEKSVKSNVYSALIKNAKTADEVVFYQLLALGSYGAIRTPLRGAFTALKQYIPFAGEAPDIYEHRRAAINAAKELADDSKAFIVSIQEAMSTDDKMMKWVSVIDAFNAFADSYNSKTIYFSSMYDALSIKSRHDKMIKTRKELKDKQKGESYELSDFSEYDWRDTPTLSSSRFKPIEKIKL